MEHMMISSPRRPDIAEHEGLLAAHLLGVALHDRRTGADEGREAILLTTKSERVMPGPPQRGSRRTTI
jgi:hypothetical protein